MFASFGECTCGGKLSAIRFIEVERDKYNISTGYIRTAVSYLQCDSCLKNHCVDDSFDGPWRSVSPERIKEIIESQSLEF